MLVALKPANNASMRLLPMQKLISNRAVGDNLGYKLCCSLDHRLLDGAMTAGEPVLSMREFTDDHIWKDDRDGPHCSIEGWNLLFELSRGARTLPSQSAVRR
jgi:hypothetical protein